MGLIKQKLTFRGMKDEREIVALFDSGITSSCINLSIANQLGNFMPIEKTIRTNLKDHFLLSKGIILLTFVINGVDLSDSFNVVENLSDDIIIGAATMQKYRIKLDFSTDAVWVDPKLSSLQII